MKLGRLALFGLAVVVVGVTLTQIPDISRYLKMKMM